MLKGEIWRVRLPITSGHAQAGDRPALIVQDTHLIRALPTALVVPFTTAPGGAKFPGTLPVQPTPENGLSQPSTALVFQLRAIDKRDFSYRMGTLEPDMVGRVLGLIDELLGR